MDKKYSIEEYTRDYIVGYAKDNDYVLTLLDEGRAVGEMKIEERHKNPLNTVHGGVVFAIADTIGGIAARTMDVIPTTCSSTINYLRPTMGAEKLMADAKVIKCGKNTVAVEIAVFDDKGKHVSEVLATYFNLSIDALM